MSSRWWLAGVLLLAILIYVVLAVWVAYTKAPWCDEGQYANSSYDLAFRGRLSTSVVEPSGYYLNAYFRGAQQRTYFNVPFQLVALAGWFRVFGASSFSARIYSICWGAITLPVLFYILRRLFSDQRVAALGTLLTGMDFVFLWSTADARMEAAANALALCSLAAYLHFREKDFQKAVVSSQVLGACAVFTHPNAALVVLAMTIIGWRYDRNRLRLHGWRYLVLAAAPYLLFGVLWSFYIFQSPGDFAAQFLAQAAGHNAERFRTLVEPYDAIQKEIHRHLAAYADSGLWGGAKEGWMGLIPLLYLPAMIWFLWNWRRHEAPVRMFLEYTVVMLLGMTFLNGFKGYFYLIYLVPVYNAVFAVWLSSFRRWGLEGRCLAVTIGVIFASLQLSTSIVHIRADEYHRDYEPAIRELARDRTEGKSILGTAALGFGMGFSGFKDDARLGMYSGLSPDVVVIDRAYRTYSGFYRNEEPAVFQHTVTMLSTNYRLTAQYGSFWIFERDHPGLGGKPWIDAQRMAMLPEMGDHFGVIPGDRRE